MNYRKILIVNNTVPKSRTENNSGTNHRIRMNSFNTTTKIAEYIYRKKRMREDNLV